MRRLWRRSTRPHERGHATTVWGGQGQSILPFFTRLLLLSLSCIFSDNFIERLLKEPIEMKFIDLILSYVDYFEAWETCVWILITLSLFVKIISLIAVPLVEALTK